MSLGPHAVFIWSSYAAMALGMAGLLAWLFVDGRKQKRALADFEARGVRRRSAERQPAATKTTDEA
jgi:heme exporter protein D